jgi:hypothetical protein
VIGMADERDLALAAALRQIADAMVVSAARRAGAPEPIAQVAPTVVEGVAVTAAKKRRKKSAYQRKFSQVLKEETRKAKTKSGAYRKGMTAAKVMRKAHAITKREMRK